MTTSETREEELHFAECLFSDLMSRHPELNMYKRFSRNIDRAPLFSEDIGKSVMYTWHVTRCSIETKLRNDFPKFAKDEKEFKKYLRAISCIIGNITNCDYTRIVEFSAILLGVISFLYRRGVTRFLNNVPYYWHFMFTCLVSKDFHNMGGWEALALLAKKRAESYDDNIREIRTLYFLGSTERSFENINKAKKPVNSFESSSGLANPDLPPNVFTTESSMTTDIKNSGSVIESKNTISSAGESLSCDVSEKSEENLKYETGLTDISSKPIKPNIAEASFMDTKSKTIQSLEMASLKSKVAFKTGKSKPATMSSEFSSGTGKPSISPLQKKKPVATDVKPKQPLKSPSRVITKSVPSTSPSPSKKLSEQKTKHIPPVIATTPHVKIFTKTDAVNKHIERMGRQQKQTTAKSATQTSRKPSAVPSKFVHDSISFRQTPKPKEKASTESSSKSKTLKKSETESIPVGYAYRLPETSPEKVKKTTEGN